MNSLLLPLPVLSVKPNTTVCETASLKSMILAEMVKLSPPSKEFPVMLMISTFPVGLSGAVLSWHVDPSPSKAEKALLDPKAKLSPLIIIKLSQQWNEY